MLEIALVGSLLICTSGLGGLAGHMLGVSRAGGPLARRVAGLRSTGSAFRGPAVHPSKTPLWRGLQETKAGLARPRFGGVAKKSLYTNMPLCKLGASSGAHGPSSTNPNVPSRRFPPRTLGSFPRQSHAAC